MKQQKIPKHDVQVPINPLKAMFIRQLVFQKALGRATKIAPGKIIAKESMDHLNEMLTAIAQETAEAREWIPWKSWSKKKKVITKDDRWEFLNELIDIQHFVINSAIIMDCTYEEFAYMFFNKQHENKLRQKRGY